jgi:hypothetical protein
LTGTAANRRNPPAVVHLEYLSTGIFHARNGLLTERWGPTVFH